MRKVFFIVFMLLSSINAHARKPAVEPIVGVSIEEYKEVDPSQAKGFNFGKEVTKSNPTAQDAREADYHPEQMATQSLKEKSEPGQLILILFVFLPVIASGFLFFKNFKKDEEHQNVYDLEAIKKQKENQKPSDDHDDISKAS